MVYGKVPKSKHKKKPGWKQEEIEYQEHMKKLGINPYSKKSKPKFTDLKSNLKKTERKVKSLNSNVGSTTKKEIPKYTGDKIIGISIVHKSCLQPISSKEAAVDVARMRRG